MVAWKVAPVAPPAMQVARHLISYLDLPKSYHIVMYWAVSILANKSHNIFKCRRNHKHSEITAVNALLISFEFFSLQILWKHFEVHMYIMHLKVFASTKLGSVYITSPQLCSYSLGIREPLCQRRRMHPSCRFDQINQIKIQKQQMKRRDDMRWPCANAYNCMQN